MALDLGEYRLAALSTLPFTTWLRLAHANEDRDTACAILGEQPLAECARRLRRLDARRCDGQHAQSRRFAGFALRLHVVSARASIYGNHLTGRGGAPRAHGARGYHGQSSGFRD